MTPAYICHGTMVFELMAVKANGWDTKGCQLRLASNSCNAAACEQFTILHNAKARVTLSTTMTMNNNLWFLYTHAPVSILHQLLYTRDLLHNDQYSKCHYSASIINVSVSYVNVRILRHLKQEVAWAIDKWLRVISNTMLVKTVIPRI